MSSEETTKKPKKKRSIGGWIFRVMAGFEVAIICLLLIFAATFFGTLEQTDVGLYLTLQKYFDHEALLFFPEINGKKLWLPLPGTFWVCCVLFVNLFMGGLIRARKGWKTVGVLISHFGMLFLILAGGVSEMTKKEGLMRVFQGDRSDYAQSFTEPTIEIYTYDEKGEREAPYVVEPDHFAELDSDETLTIRLPDLPFDVEVTEFRRACSLLQYSQSKSNHNGEPIVDGFFLQDRIRAGEEERNEPGCHLTLRGKDGEELQKLIVHHPSLFALPFPIPVTATIEGKRYGFSFTRQIWPMPFQVELRKTLGEYYPGTRDPSWFQSDITKVADEVRRDYKIVMNKPMRHQGITLYQARWDAPQPGGRPFSGFQIVENPSDQWPKYALYIATFGLLVHFGTKLSRFLNPSRRTKTDVAKE